MVMTPGSIQQAAVIAVRARRVCLVRSRSRKRWVIPKGCLERSKTARQVALQEAWEEAGLLGVLHRNPLGSYLSEKSGKTHLVTVFLLNVTQVADDWPERTWRRRCWLSPARARVRVEQRGLREVIRTVTTAILQSAAS
jgi:8-oxo-dGTP pyrophosphatase MutT (NUDIX family)